MDLPSTGPRPRGRGNKVKGFLADCRLHGFNGAAPARARKFLPHRPHHPRVRLLQWGRARAGAEICADGKVQPGPYVLQWGRARAGAEINLAGLTLETPLALLQWGRARAGAEIIKL